MISSHFRLKVQKIDQVCLFELSWGQGQQLSTKLKYPVELTKLYQEWRRLYLNFYRTVQAPIPAVPPDSENAFRGWAIGSGSATPTAADWQPKLVEAQVRLLNEFNLWLRSAELHEIRAAIAQASSRKAGSDQSPLKVFLTCTPIELARLPWEVWEIGADFAGTGAISIVRTPANIRSEPSFHSRRRHRARVLAIMGDETGLNFQVDRDAVRSLCTKADVKFIGWQPGQTAAQVKEQICRCLTDAEGWDVLYFAGHSDETQITGGELAIAPGVTIYIHEIELQLSTAKRQGLQFAFFNSCSGLSIAESLINVGLSQVAVMREPVSNALAHEFFVQFARGLSEYQDVHEALLSACQFLKLEKNFYYPSGFLIPSLFCHPGAELFRIARSSWNRSLRQLLPTRWEAIALTVFLVFGLNDYVQSFLLDQRIWVQAVYRDITEQTQIVSNILPPVALVQIDETSLRKEMTSETRRIDDEVAPISRTYLAALLKRLVDQNAKVLGVDYLFKYPTSQTEELRSTLENLVKEHGMWVVFAAPYQSEVDNIFVAEQGKVADRDWSQQGSADYFVFSYPSYVTLPYSNLNSDKICYETCPFSYLLSLIQAANQNSDKNLLQNALTNGKDLRTSFLRLIWRGSSQNQLLNRLQRTHLNSISSWLNKQHDLVTFQPIIDFSIPPNQVYDRITAWRLLEEKPLALSNLPRQVVIIGAGEYNDLNSAVGGELDIYPVPSAIKYWRGRLPAENNAFEFRNGDSANAPKYLPVFTGAEAHAYMVHHLLTQRLVVPIPFLLIIGVFALISKIAVTLLRHQQHQRAWNRRTRSQYLLSLAGATTLYGLVSLQLYISNAVLLPWLLPSLLFWIYILPLLRRRPNV
jgi:hypothetical protein